MPLDNIDHILIVLSGKGGVGKSTMSCQLAFALAHGLHLSEADHDPVADLLNANTSALKVGILDVDLCGPSVPKILGVEGSGVVSGGARGGWLPVRAALPPTARPGAVLEVMSIGFLLPSANDAVVWRGPRKDAMIKQFLEDVEWGFSTPLFGAGTSTTTTTTRDGLNILIVDTPPGTSDEHMTLCEALVTNLQGLAGQGRRVPNVGAVVVTTPQSVALDDVIKELNFCQRLKLRCFGIIENMDGYVCPHCRTLVPIFTTQKAKKNTSSSEEQEEDKQKLGIHDGRSLAAAFGVPYLGSVPLDPMLSLCEDEGVWIESKQQQQQPSSSSSVTAVEKEEEGESTTRCGVAGEGGVLPSVAALREVVKKTVLQIRRSEDQRRKEMEERIAAARAECEA